MRKFEIGDKVVGRFGQEGVVTNCANDTDDRQHLVEIEFTTSFLKRKKRDWFYVGNVYRKTACK